ncbi:hypothetical protein PG275_09185 [Riemerella anatipestifer]|nr:hypothetical protein [Riemerella anatipestifer]
MEKKIKKEYKETSPSEILRFGNNFIDEFLLDNDAIEIPINALKIIFNVVSTLRNEQFQSNTQPQQLKLFEDEFASEHNSYAVMKVKNSLITSNSKVLKDTYKFLENYKKDWYEFITSEGKKVKALGGLISNVFYEENGYTTFLISSYWLKKIIDIPTYNHTLYNMVYRVRSNKHILFWFWLSKVPNEGTKILRSKLNEMYGINYSNSKDLCGKFLKPIRENLNKYSHISFNYSIEKDLIHIKPYAVKNISDIAFSEEIKGKVKNNYKIRYFKDRHCLKETDIKGIAYIFNNIEDDKALLLKAYKCFVKYCRANNKKATEYTGQTFIETLQEFIKLEYLKSETGKKYPNAYPRI